MNILRWFLSKTVREACTVRKHYARLLAAQRDVLPPQAVGPVLAALIELDAAIGEGSNKGRIRIKAEELQFAAEKWLKPYPHAAWRENVEVLLVALAVAMGIRTFFLQPFKIPTGSMQPTLFGVTSTPDFTKINYRQDDRSKVEAAVAEQVKLRDALVIPTGLDRIKAWFTGASYLHVVAEADGELEKIEKPVGFLIFNIKQTIWIGGHPQTIWFPPDYGEQPLWARAGLRTHEDFGEGQLCKQGQDLVKIQLNAGDHLFVDRISYNFTKPQRGQIIVFETAGIPEEMRDRYRIPGDEFYIKRLVALPGEHVQVGDDRHLRINGERLDAGTPHFENIYGFDPKLPPRESQFSGHVNGTIATKFGLYPGLAPMFPDEPTIYNNPNDSFMVMGDNTCNSLDSRSWGSFPTHSVIGKSFFVYWPITKRFGWGNQ